VLETFDFSCGEEDMDVADLKSKLQQRLDKMDCKLRMLIYRGQILQNGKKMSDYKLKHGETVQLLTWISDSAAAAATAASQANTASSEQQTTSPRGGAQALAAVMDAQPGFTLQAQAGLRNNLVLQEEVERWAARVKVWTCMLMLIYSFKLLVGMSQSLEPPRDQHSTNNALSFLGFWVAYIGLRSATRFNFSLARGYFYGQLTVGLCNLFLMGIHLADPTKANPVTAGADTQDGSRAIPANVAFISLAINTVFWAYIVYGAFRYQRALWLWLQDGAPEHILQSQEEV